ncbi:MAG: YraN family protein [Pseudomonadota bacterium]
MSKRAQGSRAESSARMWLEQRGLEHVESNYHCRQGEIDLVMRDNGTLVLVEVRMRRSGQYGGAAASVDYHKQRKLRRSVAHYTASRSVSSRQVCRIDVVAIEAIETAWQVDWIQNAICD